MPSLEDAISCKVGVGQGLAVVVCCPSEPFVLAVVGWRGRGGEDCRCLMSNQALRWLGWAGWWPRGPGPSQTPGCSCSQSSLWLARPHARHPPGVLPPLCSASSTFTQAHTSPIQKNSPWTRPSDSPRPPAPGSPFRPTLGRATCRQGEVWLSDSHPSLPTAPTLPSLSPGAPLGPSRPPPGKAS